MIHPTAIIDPQAELDPTVEVGPYAVVEAGVILGAGCRVGPHVVLRGRAVFGRDNVFHPGAVIGGDSQDLKYRGQPTGLRIGDRNTFREHVTVNRSSEEGADTVIGSDNLLMAGSHVGHNTRLGNFVRLANCALLAGHVDVEDHAIISGGCLVHQFVRVGALSMMQGGTAISLDLPPYCMAHGRNHLCGLNIVGLRRAGFSESQRSELKRTYRTLFRSGLPLKRAVQNAQAEFTGDAARALIDFVARTERGVCSDAGRAVLARESSA